MIQAYWDWDITELKKEAFFRARSADRVLTDLLCIRYGQYPGIDPLEEGVKGRFSSRGLSGC